MFNRQCSLAPGAPCHSSSTTVRFTELLYLTWLPLAPPALPGSVAQVTGQLTPRPGLSAEPPGDSDSLPTHPVPGARNIPQSVTCRFQTLKRRTKSSASFSAIRVPRFKTIHPPYRRNPTNYTDVAGPKHLWGFISYLLAPM